MMRRWFPNRRYYMARRFSLLLLLALALTIPATASAGFGIYGSWWDGDDFGSGFGAGVKKDLDMISVPLIGLDVRGSFLSFSDDSFETVTVVPLEAAAKLDLGIFYAGLGVGWYIFNQSISDQFGGFLVGGAKISLGGFGIFGELLYRTVNKNPVDGVGVNLGVTLGL
jgi:hypothetical protein